MSTLEQAAVSRAGLDRRLLVDTLIHHEWRRRMRRLEAVLWEQAANTFPTQHSESEACNSSDAFTSNFTHGQRLRAQLSPRPQRTLAAGSIPHLEVLLKPPALSYPETFAAFVPL